MQGRRGGFSSQGWTSSEDKWLNRSSTHIHISEQHSPASLKGSRKNTFSEVMGGAIQHGQMKTWLLSIKVHTEGCKGFFRDPIQSRQETNERRWGFPVSDLGFIEEMAKAYPVTSSIHVVTRGWESWLTEEPAKSRFGLRMAPLDR